MLVIGRSEVAETVTGLGLLKYEAFTNVMRQGFGNWKEVSTG